MDNNITNNNNGFFSLSPEDYILLALVIAFIIGESLEETQRAILGNFLVAVGTNMINLTPGAWQV